MIGKTKFAVPKSADGFHREISSMFAAPSKERSRNGASQTCGKDTTKPGSKVKKKAHSLEVNLPPLCPEPPSLSAAFAARSLLSCTTILRNVPSDRPLSVVELPRLIAQVGPGRAIADTKWTEGPRLMASALGTDIPVRTADELTAQRYMEYLQRFDVDFNAPIHSDTVFIHVTDIIQKCHAIVYVKSCANFCRQYCNHYFRKNKYDHICKDDDSI